MKKKRNKKKAPQAAPPTVAVQRLSPPLLFALCATALAAAYAAMLGGISDGAMDIRDMFNLDTAYPHELFRDIFHSFADPSGFRLSTSPMWFPDMVPLLWPLYAAGLGWVMSHYVAAVLQAMLGAAGWMLVCARLGGGWTTRCAVLLAWAAPFLAMGYGKWIFAPQVAFTEHFGAWVCAPWLLWLALPDNGEKDSAPLSRRRLAALALLLAVCVAADLLAVTWFAAPAGAAAVFLFFRGRWTAPKTATFLAALALGVVAGYLLRNYVISFFTPSLLGESYTSFNPEKSADAARWLVRMFGFIAQESPPLFVVWTAFVILAIVRFRRATAAKSRQTGATVFAAVFVCAALVLPPLAVVAVGNYGDFLNTGPSRYWFHIRYFMPTLYLPLFVGWTLPPMAAAFHRFSRWKSPAVAALALATCAASVPKIAAIDSEKLSPFNLPFHRCASEAAQSRGWRGVVGNGFFTSELVADPSNGIERELPVITYNHRIPADAPRRPMLMEWALSNRNWAVGEFDFVIVNGRGGRVYGDTPGLGDDSCPASDFIKCTADFAIIDEASVVATFGDPDEKIECAGLLLLAYDPPVRVDMSGVSSKDWGWEWPLQVLPRN